jgi:hypothetical protein
VIISVFLHLFWFYHLTPSPIYEHVVFVTGDCAKTKERKMNRYRYSPSRRNSRAAARRYILSCLQIMEQSPCK